MEMCIFLGIVEKLTKLNPPERTALKGGSRKKMQHRQGRKINQTRTIDLFMRCVRMLCFPSGKFVLPNPRRRPALNAQRAVPLKSSTYGPTRADDCCRLIYDGQKDLNRIQDDGVFYLFTRQNVKKNLWILPPFLRRRRVVFPWMVVLIYTVHE